MPNKEYIGGLVSKLDYEDYKRVKAIHQDLQGAMISATELKNKADYKYYQAQAKSLDRILSILEVEFEIPIRDEKYDDIRGDYLEDKIEPQED